MTSSKISSFQVIILIFLCRIFNMLNYITPFNNNIDNTALLWGNVLSFVFQAILLLPAIFLFKKFNGENVIDVVYRKAKPLGIIIAIVYGLFAFLNVAGTIVGFEYFMSNAVYPHASIFFLTLTISIACFYASTHGIEGLARAALFVFVFFIIGALIIGLSSISLFEPNKIKPILDNRNTEIFKAFIEVTAKSTDIIILILLFPKIKGSVSKTSFSYLLITLAVIELSTILMIVILGDFAYTQVFPYYTLATVVETSIIQRMDSIHMMSWVFISVIRICLHSIVTKECFDFFISKKAKKYSMLIIYVFAVILAILTLMSSQIIEKINSNTSILITVLTCIIPLLTLIFTRKDHKKIMEGEKINET